ncbi:MAG: bifunctional methylenetetrahydrofolate dehydrogenase/methenyltetrahydrofolate cyclohydrolase, partial [Candidatus Thioglobus sp.]
MIIDGKQIAKKIKISIAEQVAKLDRKPGLAVVLVGDDPASAVYVRNKDNACREVGFYAEKINKPADITQVELLAEVERLNEDSNIDGILVQLPLPSHIDTTKILEVIDPAKDVDGFHPYNMGRVVEGLDAFAPCTPVGVMEMFKEYN